MNQFDKNPLLPEPSEESVEMQYVKGLVNRLTQQPKAVKGACKKCGFSGHLTFQCMNHISIGAEKKELSLAQKLSSDESGEYNSEIEERKKRKRKNKQERNEKRLKLENSADEKKKLKKEMKKKKQKHKSHKT
ncbi:hypothetical protein LOD99_7548 [Oopsacas minuta]|uniref:CCHC-type domain-containing protein n=1 Tax=Oopsacas minuta TaxID=111878 RepID=A0AAV7JP38_9METZ|nr:hypothetical protein LOD99_7548 [Oopsacas minuta]